MSVVALTGAGISTESGIPDYRGPNGLWRRDPAYERLVTIDSYLADADLRRKSWLFRRDSPAWQASPNAAHYALARLPDVWIITQNVDQLHQRAGSPAERVLELHGNMFDALCVSCGARSATREAIERVLDGEDDPRCRDCGGILKTATVMFGQSLDGALLRQAVAVTRAADTFLAIGTSLQVQPAASLVEVAAEAGAHIVIVNDTPTQYDQLADEVRREPISQAVPLLCAELVGA